MARYRVRDAAEWAFHSARVEDVLRVEVTAAMVRSLGEMGVDRVLSDGRKNLIATATRRAQAGLDACRSGLELVSLELTRLSPPLALSGDFNAVQSAFIGAETKKKWAQAFAETAIPQAQAKADAAVQSARGAADSDLAVANGDAQAFLVLDRGISGQSRSGSRAPLPRCRGKGHRRRWERALGAAADRRPLRSASHHVAAAGSALAPAGRRDEDDDRDQ